MLQTVKNKKYGTITYEESFWTGKKIIKIDGVQLTKVKGRKYSYKKDGKTVDVEIKGSFLAGVKLVIGGEQIIVMEAPKWYEFLIVIAGFIFNMVWSLVCETVIIVGGGIGGALYALAAMGAILVSRNVKKPIFKILVCIGFSVAGFLAGFAIALFLITSSLLF